MSKKDLKKLEKKNRIDEAKITIYDACIDSFARTGKDISPEVVEAVEVVEEILEKYGSRDD